MQRLTAQRGPGCSVFGTQEKPVFFVMTVAGEEISRAFSPQNVGPTLDLVMLGGVSPSSCAESHLGMLQQPYRQEQQKGQRRVAEKK